MVVRSVPRVAGDSFDQQVMEGLGARSLTPSHFAAARLTIGVSSEPREVNPFRSSSCIAGDTFA